MRFNNGEEFLKAINENGFYNKEKCIYVFSYNDYGSVAVYSIDNKEADELRKKSQESNEYWGAFLGIGGSIYDDVSYYKEIKNEYDTYNKYTNLNWCEDNYYGEWERMI